MDVQLVKVVLLPFATALGVVLGGAFGGASAVLFTAGSPVETVHELAQSLKLWAILVAIGGTFPTIQALEVGLLGGQLYALAKQVVMLLSAYAGAQLGHWLVLTLTGAK